MSYILYAFFFRVRMPRKSEDVRFFVLQTPQLYIISMDTEIVFPQFQY